MSLFLRASFALAIAGIFGSPARAFVGQTSGPMYSSTAEFYGPGQSFIDVTTGQSFVGTDPSDEGPGIGAISSVQLSVTGSVSLTSHASTPITYDATGTVDFQLLWYDIESDQLVYGPKHYATVPTGTPHVQIAFTDTVASWYPAGGPIYLLINDHATGTYVALDSSDQWFVTWYAGNCGTGYVFDGTTCIGGVLFGGTDDAFASKGASRSTPNFDSFLRVDSGGIPTGYAEAGATPDPSTYTWPCNNSDEPDGGTDSCGDPWGTCLTNFTTAPAGPTSCAAGGSCRLVADTGFSGGPSNAPKPPGSWGVQPARNILRVTTGQQDIFAKGSPGSDEGANGSFNIVLTNVHAADPGNGITADQLTIKGVTFVAVTSGQTPPTGTHGFTVDGIDSDGASALATQIHTVFGWTATTNGSTVVMTPANGAFAVTEETPDFTIDPPVATGFAPSPTLQCTFDQTEPRNEIEEPLLPGSSTLVPIGLGDQTTDATHQDEYFVWWIYLPDTTGFPDACQEGTTTGTLECTNLRDNLIQFHQNEAAGHVCGSSPPIAFGLSAHHHGEDPETNLGSADISWYWVLSSIENPGALGAVWSAPVQSRGTWHSFMLHIFWSESASTSRTGSQRCTSRCTNSGCTGTSTWCPVQKNGQPVCATDWCPSGTTCTDIADCPSPLTDPGGGVLELWMDGALVYSEPRRTIWDYSQCTPADLTGPVSVVFKTGIYRDGRMPADHTVYMSSYSIIGGPQGTGSASFAAARALVDGWDGSTSP